MSDSHAPSEPLLTQSLGEDARGRSGIEKLLTCVSTEATRLIRK